MALNDNGRNACLSGGLGNAVSHISLHSGIPDATGSSELTGGSPAYARQAVTWGAAASGARSNSGSLLHDVPAGTVYGYGLWSALTSGTYYGFIPLNGSVKGFGTVDSGGVTNDLVTSNGHGLSDGQQVVLDDVFAESVPAGLNKTTAYFVVSSATDTFKLSLTSGGAAVNITGQGELFFQKIVPEVFASQGQESTAASALILDATGI